MSSLLSVIVPSRDRERHLTRCLKALLAQRSARLQIVVVDDGTGGVPQRVVGRVTRREDTGSASVEVAQTDREEGGGVNRARNRGLEAATGDLIAFLDDDIEVPLDWASRLITTAAAHPEAGCIGGPYRLHAEKMPRFHYGRHCDRDHLAHFSFLPRRDGNEPFLIDEVWGANFAVRRAAIDEIGPFDAALSGAGDEVEWQVRLHRAGGRILFDPGLEARHWRHASELTLLSLMRQKLLRERTRPRYWRRVALSEHPSASGSFALAIRCLLHATRCRGGLIDAAGYFGLGLGLVSRPAKTGSRPDLAD